MSTAHTRRRGPCAPPAGPSAQAGDRFLSFIDLGWIGAAEQPICAMPRAFEIVVGNDRAVFDLLDDDAPTVCASFVNSLPIDSFSVHAKFAGDELIVMVPFFENPENEIFWVKPGDVGYYPGRQTICMFYGPTEPFGQVSVFARCREEHLSILRKWGQEILTRGSVPVSVRMHDPAVAFTAEEVLG